MPAKPICGDSTLAFLATALVGLAGTIESGRAAAWEIQVGSGSLSAVVDTLSHAVAGRQFIAGDRFSAADVYTGSQIGWGMHFGTVEKRPEFEASWAGLQERPAQRRVEACVREVLAKHRQVAS